MNSLVEHLRRPCAPDVLIAAAIAVLAVAETALGAGHEPLLAHFTAALAMSAALPWRRSAPLGVLVAVFLPLTVMAGAGEALDGAYVMAVLLVAFAAVGAHCERRRAVAGLALGLVLLVIVLLAENVVAGPPRAPRPVTSSSWRSSSVWSGRLR